MTKYIFRKLFVLILLVLLFQPELYAQSAVRFQSLEVAIWPEYDRPETLVIYRGELAETTSLPAQLTFRLPGHIEQMHAVATEEAGRLVTVNPDLIEMNYQDETLLLSFPTTSRQIQLEYYDARLLSREDQTRQLSFNFIAPVPIETAIFEVQEPLGSEDFSLSPRPDTIRSGGRLQYHQIEMTDVAQGQAIRIEAAYQRSGDELTAPLLAAEQPAAPPAPVETGTVATAANARIAYLLVGVGILLLLGSGGYWWWSRRPKPARRRAPGRKKKGQPAGFCYKCGAALRADANFCHVCGAERRTD